MFASHRSNSRFNALSQRRFDSFAPALFGLSAQPIYVARFPAAPFGKLGKGGLEVFHDFGGDDAGIRHDWVLVPFHLIEIISRLCCFVHLRIWNGTKERNTDTAA